MLDRSMEKSTIGGCVSNDSLKQLTNPRTKVAEDIQIVEDSVYTPGFTRSMTGSEIDRPKINLEVTLEGAQLRAITNGPDKDSSNLSDFIAQTQVRPTGTQASQEKIKGETSKKRSSTSKGGKNMEKE